ncbi:MAG: response regulator, partial [Candidatus Nitrosotenuis sp.]
LGLYYGALLVMCLYNLFIYFSVRDTAYLFYVSYIAFSWLTYFVINGLVFQYLWPAPPLAGLGFAMCALVCAILFSRSFLNTRETMPKTDKILLGLAVIYSVNALLMFTGSATFAITTSVAYFSGLALPPLLLYAGIRNLRLENRQARYYVLAWATYLAGLLLYILKDLGVLPYSFITAYSMQIGTLTDVVLLSLALADRIRMLREEKETAQNRIIEQEHRALKISEEARATLDKEVVERTAQLKEALDRLQKIASRVPGIVYQFRMRADGGTSVPYASDAARAIYRLDPEEVRGDASKTFACVHPDDVDTYVASIQASARDLTPWIHEYRLKFGDEPDVWLLGNAIPQREPDGSTLWHGFITDITERKRTEEARRKSEERWKFAVEGSQAGIFDWNIQTGESECTERWKEIYGIEGKTFEECMSRTYPEDQADTIASLQAHFDGKTPTAKHEYRIMDGNGGWKWVLGRGLAVKRDADGKPLRVVGTITDISGRKQAELELRQAKEQAENATRLKDKFVSLVTHDLRGPLSSLAMGLKTLHGSDDLSPADQLFVGKMAAHSRELLNLTERLLDLSQLQTGRIVPRKRFINCRGFASAQIGLFQNMAARKEIAIVNNIPETMKVYADPDLAGECVKNLLSNAIKFCGKGDTITLFNPPDMPSAIAVKDDGPGIKPDKLPSLFKAEMKKRSVGTAGEKGTGIGLAHVKELMEANGGGIAFESAPGKGSAFFLIFPHSFNITVLVVDDQEAVRAAIREHCAGIFPGILEAGNGEEALAVIKTVTPHLIITDINMPVMDGLQFIQAVRNDGMARHVPIIAMTSDEARFASNGMDIRSYCLHIGANDFVNKPVAANDLVPRV